MDNGSEEGGMWLRSRENLDSEREGELDLHAREEVDFDASDEEHPGFVSAALHLAPCPYMLSRP